MLPKRKIIVAIDGPAASGKSTTARELAKKLGYVYIDTGAMYRACALQAKREGISMKDNFALAAMMERIKIQIISAAEGNIILLNEEDVSQQIRTPDISAAASAISAIPCVRYKMVDLQRKLGKEGGVVLEGRDIGTFVFPQAEAKFYLIAAEEIRAERRYKELLAKGITTDFKAVLQDLQARDAADANRALAPLKPAKDAILIDTSKLTIEEQVQKLYEITCGIIDRLGNDNADSKPNENKVEIRLAPFSGFCFGVRRAIQLAQSAKISDKPVYTLGELIHNPGIIKDLEKQGIHTVYNASEIKNSTVIIRSHGITQEEYNKLQENNNEIIDATCPYVNRTHTIMQKMADEGYPVLILGDKQHPEVKGMISYGNTKIDIINEDEPLPEIEAKRLAIMAQTTQRIEKFRELVCKLLPKVDELRVFNTICLATTQRQKATEELSQASEVMFVIGGLNSSNTRALAKLSSLYCPTYHIEDEKQLAEIDISSYKKIGITAGASTPEEMIIKVYNVLLKKSGDFNTVSAIEEIPMFKEESC